MYNLTFFKSRLGSASLISIAAMVAMNVLALNSQLGAMPGAYAVAPLQVELA